MDSSLGPYCINVTDLERSIRFYVEGLGLAVESRNDISETLKEAIVWKEGEGAMLQLAHHTDREGPLDHGNAFWKLYVNTDDCQGLYNRALAAGAISISEPKALDRWPVTIAFVEDPDGYTIELIEYHH